MFSFDRLKIDQIPLGESKHRIEYLTEFRDSLNQFFGWVVYGTTRPDVEERRTDINKRKPLAHRMITLAGIETVRECARRNPPTSSTLTVGLDVIDELWSLESLHLSLREPINVIEEAIGEYERDQKKARGRSRNPFFWAVWTFAWIAEFPPSIFSRVSGVDQDKAERSKPGQLATALVQASLWIFALIAALAGLFYLLEFLGFKDALLRCLKLK